MQRGKGEDLRLQRLSAIAMDERESGDWLICCRVCLQDVIAHNCN
jgi:hypothetical protein